MASVSRGFLEENLWKCFRKIAPLPFFLRNIETRDVTLPGCRNFVNAVAGVYMRSICTVPWEAGQHATLIKKETKFSSYIRKFRMEQLQSHIRLTASSFMEKYLRISSYIRKPFLIFDFATAPLWISLYMRKIWFSFFSVYTSVLTYYNLVWITLSF